MKQYKDVQGSLESAAPFIINHDNIYIHTNIHKVQDPELEDSDLYEYDEIVMTKDEYIEYTHNYINDLELAIAELGVLVAEV